MGTLIFWGMIVLGLFIVLVLFSLLRMAKRSDQIYESMLSSEEIATPADVCSWRATETLAPTSSGEARPQRDLRVSVAAP